MTVNQYNLCEGFSVVRSLTVYNLFCSSQRFDKIYLAEQFWKQSFYVGLPCLMFMCSLLRKISYIQVVTYE